MHEQVAELISELAAWNNGAGISAKEWVTCIGRYDHAMGYAILFWPDFVLYDECIFAGQPDAKAYEQWLTTCHGGKTEVEAVMSHLHIADLLVNSNFKATREVVRHIGRLLKDMWSCKLRRDFPERQVTVEFHDDDSDDLLSYQITFFQERL
jgi:hypothetical protein